MRGNVAAAMTKVLGEATAVLDRHDVLGEGPAWDAANERLVWCDINGLRIHELRRDGDSWSAGASWTMPDRPGAVVPRREGGLIAMVGHEFCVLGDDGSLEPFAAVDLNGAPARFNDCKVDPRGRLLAGTMVLDLSQPGQLVRLDPDGSITTLLSDIELSNGLDWSPDGATFYFTDTPTLGIDAFDYDLDAGTISNRRRVVTIERGEGAPDGMCVDDEGCIWTATLYSRAVRRYSPEGELLGIVETAAHQVSSCAFGGADGGELFITTIGENVPRFLPEGIGIPADLVDASEANPANGLLFSCRPGVTGPAARAFAG
jgi:sugar lactone lactonase YvrE